MELAARIAYAAYGESTGGKNYQGNPMPPWEHLGDAIQAAWLAAAEAVADYLAGPEPMDETSYISQDRIALGD